MLHIYGVFWRDAVVAKTVHELCQVLDGLVHVSHFLHDVLLQPGLRLVVHSSRW